MPTNLRPPQMPSKRSTDATRCTNRLPVSVPRRGTLCRIAGQNRSEYSAEQLHAGMATPRSVPAGHTRFSARAYPSRSHNSGHHGQGVLHLARRLLGAEINTLAGSGNPFPAPPPDNRHRNHACERCCAVPVCLTTSRPAGLGAKGVIVVVEHRCRNVTSHRGSKQLRESQTSLGTTTLHDLRRYVPASQRSVFLWRAPCGRRRAR